MTTTEASSQGEGRALVRASEAEQAKSALALVDVPEELRDNLALFLRLVRKVLMENDPDLLATFDLLLGDAIRVTYSDGVARTDEKAALAEKAFQEFVSTIDGLSMDRATLLMRAFVTYFHLANICEENYRVSSLRRRESEVPTT